MNSTIHRFIIHVYIIKLWMRISFFTASPFKDTKNLRNNGRIRVKFDKWLVHIPFLCYLTILLISAEGAVYGGY